MNPRRALIVGAALVALIAPLAGCGGSSGGHGTESSVPYKLCGNARLDSGERCDDGNTDDTDDCTSACQPARCGDGVVHAGVEQCDGFNLNRADCDTFNLDGAGHGLLRCNASCQYDTSRCGPLFTSTATPTVTPTATDTATVTPTGQTAPPTDSPTPTPSPTPNPCGDGFLEPPEACDCAGQPATCVACPEDCQVLACPSPGMPTQHFEVDFSAPAGKSPSNVSILIGYRSDRVSLPTAASSRVKNRPPNTSALVNNLDYALRVLLSAQAGNGLPNGEFFTVDFDSCADAAPVGPSDFGCEVESCGSSFGPVDGCTCVVRLPAADQ